MKIRYCERLFTELVVFPDMLSPCCHMFQNNAPRFPYSGGGIDADAYRAWLSEQFDELQREDGALCKGCCELVEKDAGKEYINTALQIKVLHSCIYTGSCDLRCVYCAQQHIPKKRAKSMVPALNSILEQDLFALHPTVTWGGGEPTMHDDFSGAVSLLRSFGVHQIFYTNAIRYNAEIGATLQAKKGAVTISLDSGSREMYRIMKGRDRFGKVLETIKTYRGLSDAVEIKYIVHDLNKNKEEMDNFFELCKEMDIQTVMVACNIEDWRSNAISEDVVSAMLYFVTEAEKLRLRYLGFTTHPETWARLSQKYRRRLARKAEKISGREAYFWGAGQKFAQYGRLFRNVRPRALLVTTEGRFPRKTVDGIPLMHPEEAFASGEKLPFVMFSHSANIKNFDKIIRKYQAFCDGEPIWAAL